MTSPPKSFHIPISLPSTFSDDVVWSSPNPLFKMTKTPWALYHMVDLHSVKMPLANKMVIGCDASIKERPLTRSIPNMKC